MTDDSATIELPAPRPPAGSYTSVVVDGSYAYTSGQVAFDDDGVAYKGQLGADLSVEEGQASARGALLQSLGNLVEVIGDLDRIARVVKVTGYVRAVPEFTALPAVTDGASLVLLELLGERGRAARSTVGVAALPQGASVEIDLVVRLVD